MCFCKTTGSLLGPGLIADHGFARASNLRLQRLWSRATHNLSYCNKVLRAKRGTDLIAPNRVFSFQLPHDKISHRISIIATVSLPDGLADNGMG